MAGTKEVELWDFELWPDKVLCCTAWTGMGKPYEERTYLPERTCHNESEEWPSLFMCSECGYDNSDTYCGSQASFNYCPSCGAKVEGPVI